MSLKVPKRKSDGSMSGAVLKKHVGAIHVKGRLTLLQRKLSNVLLLNAYDELPDQARLEHSIRLRTLAEVAGFNSNDHLLLREALEALVDLKIKWNVLDHDGEEEWGVSTFLAQAVIRGGMCRYAYAPDLRKRLFSPEVYARINLAVQERFGSGYALALYENCVRFRKVGTTGWISIEQWRDLLGVEDGQFAEFKYLNRDVLKPAVAEINRYSDIAVAMEVKRVKRRVVALKFTVAENGQLVLGLGEQATRAAAEALGGKVLPDPRALAPDPERLLGPLQRRLLAFGLTEAQALDVSTEFERTRIEANLDYVEAELTRGRAVRSVPAFTIDAIRGDYRAQAGEAPVQKEVERRRREKKGAEDAVSDGAARQAAERAAKLNAERERAKEAERRRADERAARLDAVWEALPEVERRALDEQAVDRLRREVTFVYQMYERERAAGTSLEDLSIAVRSTLTGFRYDALEALAAAGEVAD
jgi:hypothetical protein